MADVKTQQLVKKLFVPPERATTKELQVDIELVSNNPVMDGLLNNVSGLIAVLNQHRQIVSLNSAFLDMLGIGNVEDLLGLRPGDAVACVHAHEEPGGCGTGRYCATCGAAIAIVTCLEQEIAVERKCALTVNRGGQEMQMALQVRANPIRVNGRMYILLFMQDITIQEQRAALERTFFHDVNNMLNMLVQASELLMDENPSSLTSAIYDASIRLSSEVAMQRCLFEADCSSYVPMWREYNAGQILQELRVFFAGHAAGRGRLLKFPDQYQHIPLMTDGSSLFRILLNMIINALEATDEGGTVRVWVEHDQGLPAFCVWNDKVIPESVALRIFQRNFSTKEQSGRGIGTFSMKLFGEKVLGGKVSFTSQDGEGTTFRFVHPVSRRNEDRAN